MQRRIQLVALTAVALALTLFGVPLGLALQELMTIDDRASLSQQAVLTALSVKVEELDGSTPIRLPEAPDGDQVGLYLPDGRRIAGQGPERADALVRGAFRTRLVDGRSGGQLVATAPLLSGDSVVAVARVARADDDAGLGVGLVWVGMAGVGLIAVAAAMMLARVMAVRLNDPIQHLRACAVELGDGNFTVRAPTSGIAEIDSVAASLNLTAQRIGDLVARERSFSAHASHQLRTPLTALKLQLDAAPGPAASADEVTRHRLAVRALVGDLEATVVDLLALARDDTPRAPLDLGPLLAGIEQRWGQLLAGRGRTLVVRRDPTPPPNVRSSALRQVLDVLVDNALQHGAGTVTVQVRDAGGAVAVDVVDRGRPGASAAELDERFADLLLSGEPAADHPTPPGGRRIGLALAQSLIAGDDGRLLLQAEPGRTCATVLLPCEPVEVRERPPGAPEAP